MNPAIDDSAALERLCGEIIRLLRPRKVLLFSRKQDRQGRPTAVKLCIIIPDGDSEGAERRLYLEVESELPFDALVYTIQEWEELLTSPGSFACRIQETGSVLYEED